MKTQITDATRWFKNGDHPLDDVLRPFEDTGKIPTEPREGKIVRYYRNPSVDGVSICEECGNTLHEHGFIDNSRGGYKVCPGNWIITAKDGSYFPEKDYIFKLITNKVNN